jgi:hypothetical protein
MADHVVANRARLLDITSSMHATSPSSRRWIRFLSFALFLAANLLPTHKTQAKAYFAPEAEMIAKSDAIAIVQIDKVDTLETKAEPFDFRQVAHSKVERTLKGTLPESILIHGNETFICAQVRLRPGRFLVCLKKVGTLLAGVNWHLSVRPIDGDKVEWYTPGTHMDLSWQPLDRVVQRVKDAISREARK